MLREFALLGLTVMVLSSCSSEKNQKIETTAEDPTKTTKETIIHSTPEKQEVLDAIVNFHNGMRQKDGDLAVSSWEKTAAGYSISIDSLGNSTKDIETPVDDEKIERIRTWLNETKDDLDEKIFDVQINIDGELAMAWVPYDFYRNKKFSHSGTNAFTLMKFDTGWKIISVADTRYFGKKIHE